MYGGSETVVVRGGTLRCGVEPDNMYVELERRDGTRERVALPLPAAGLAGLELTASPNECFAALFLYSGDAEVGWEVFELEPALRHVASQPYVAGEGLAPVFSPDSRHLATIVTVVPRERGTGKRAEKLLAPDASGEILVDWAVLYVQPIPNGAVEASPVGTWVKRSMEPGELLGWDLYESLRFTGNHRLVLPLPWGGVLQLRIPLGGPVTTPSPPKSPLPTR